MTTRELIEAVQSKPHRVTGSATAIEWLHAADYDTLVAATLAVLDGVIASYDAQVGRQYIVMHELVAAVELARALREKLR